jgi:CTP synthase
VIGGTTVDGKLVETIEIATHPFFVASQFHPEFKSRPTRAHPLFKAFVGAALARASAQTVDVSERDVPHPGTVSRA